MSRIFCVIGKTCSGKSSVVSKLLKTDIRLNPIILHTTRPMRDGESNGVEYYFDSEDEYHKLSLDCKICVCRVYNNWKYYITLDDISIAEDDYILSNISPAIYSDLCRVLGDMVVPIYINISDDGVRLLRALKRENIQSCPNYYEMCRRYMSDEDDFSDGVLKSLNIERVFENDNLSRCTDEVYKYILGIAGGVSSENELSTKLG